MSRTAKQNDVNASGIYDYPVDALNRRGGGEASEVETECDRELRVVTIADRKGPERK